MLFCTTIGRWVELIQLINSSKEYRFWEKPTNGTTKIFFRILMMAMLSAQKIHKERRWLNRFPTICHDVVLNLLSHAPPLAAMPRRFPVDSLVRLTERHFPEQVEYQGPATKRKHVPKRCRVCSARQKKTAAGHPIRSQWQSQQCPWQTWTMPRRMFQSVSHSTWLFKVKENSHLHYCNQIVCSKQGSDISYTVKFVLQSNVISKWCFDETHRL